jgi:chromosomal replication initiation ATPase DnaA
MIQKYCSKCHTSIPVEYLDEMTPDTIIKKVSEYFDISVGQIISKRRCSENVEARCIISDLLYHGLNIGYKRIGNLLGGRDHSTVINAVKRLEGLCFDERYREKYLKFHKDIFGHTRYFVYTEDYYIRQKAYRRKKVFDL